MKEKIKKIIFGYVPGFITGIIICGSISVIAATYFPSNQTTYDNSNTELKSENVQDAVDELYGVCFPKYGSDTITDLVETNSDELYKDEHGDIRYYGKDPNNYISFNDELWRIIGVIDGKIKIIRNESIGSKAWASNRYNNWNNSDLKDYLNGEYYNNIENVYRNMISEETYYLGGPASSILFTATASDYYDAERSGRVYMGNPVSTKQYIGLMYPSDYGYAAGVGCLSTALYTYDGSCYNNDYLFSGEYEWLQTPDNTLNYDAAILADFGIVVIEHSVDYVYNNVRPSLYLKAEIQIIGGDGSLNSSYEIEI